MGNPELARDSGETAWVEYLQQLLASKLEAEASAGTVRLSPVDGLFGPLTEGSVRFFQQREGLPETGIVDDATWEALEGTTAAPTAAGTPIDLRIPVQLELHWDDTTIERMLQDFDTFDLATHPGARLTLGSGAGPLAGNGSVQLFNREIPLWRNWFLTETTRLTLDWSRDHGFELGLDNEAEFGVRPLRNVDIFIQGDLDLKWQPQEARGSVDWGGSLNLRWRFDLP
ncbi:peptidoglycan-binding domain-containing protein [Actinokineospora sp.]|uniref:peptidoglycan-binding domain-containing protein n=1 Tax=Actinokineospora sp. TaxID=1872133 RepID=UPI003D6BFB27